MLTGRITLDGYDGQLMHFSAQSCSRPGLVHTIIIDRPNMQVTCTCEDAAYRNKVWRLLGTEDQPLCRHVRSLRRYILPHLEGLNL